MVLETSRPRAGRRFEPTHELALEVPAIRACESLPGARHNLVVVRELVGPVGIPDLTALVGNPAVLKARRALDVPPLLHQVDAAVVAVAHYHIGQTPAALARALAWPESTVRRRLDALLSSGAIEEVRPGRFVRQPALVPLGRIYAIETKLEKWRRALRQARTYSVWADSYVLVMGSLAPGSLSQLSTQVAADRGGLVVRGKWIRRPAVHKLARSRRLWASEHLVAAITTADYQPSVRA
jgi:hypothetical protein